MSECIAVVHHPVSVPDALTEIQSSHKFTRSGDSASGCIKGVNLEEHQIGVIEAKLVSEKMDATSNVS